MNSYMDNDRVVSEFNDENYAAIHTVLKEMRDTIESEYHMDVAHFSIKHLSYAVQKVSFLVCIKNTEYFESKLKNQEYSIVGYNQNSKYKFVVKFPTGEKRRLTIDETKKIFSDDDIALNDNWEYPIDGRLIYVRKMKDGSTTGSTINLKTNVLEAKTGLIDFFKEMFSPLVIKSLDDGLFYNDYVRFSTLNEICTDLSSWSGNNGVFVERLMIVYNNGKVEEFV